MQRNPKCPLCLQNTLLLTDVIAQNEGAYVTQAYSHPGNYLIIPKSHIEALSELPDDWWRYIKPLLDRIVDEKDNYNISVNIGTIAGQTISHIHFWVIPREAGEPSSGMGLATLIERVNN